MGLQYDFDFILFTTKRELKGIFSFFVQSNSILRKKQNFIQNSIVIVSIYKLSDEVCIVGGILCCTVGDLLIIIIIGCLCWIPVNIESRYYPFILKRSYSKNKFREKPGSSPIILFPCIRTVFKKSMPFVF